MSNEKRFTVFDGPNREQLMDAFRMQYLKGRSAPYVTFTIVSQGKKQKVGFHPTAVEYEDDIGDSFSIKGRLFFIRLVHSAPKIVMAHSLFSANHHALYFLYKKRRLRTPRFYLLKFRLKWLLAAAKIMKPTRMTKTMPIMITNFFFSASPVFAAC